METNYAMKKVFNIRSICHDSLLHLFNTITILHLQKLSVQVLTNYFWGGNEQTDWYRDHIPFQSLYSKTQLSNVLQGVNSNA